MEKLNHKEIVMIIVLVTLEFERIEKAGNNSIFYEDISFYEELLIKLKNIDMEVLDNEV